MVCVCSIAAFCWTFHYAKRLVETVVVHHFSHATSPIANIFRVGTSQPSQEEQCLLSNKGVFLFSVKHEIVLTAAE